jgi:septin family protein
MYSIPDLQIEADAMKTKTVGVVDSSASRVAPGIRRECVQAPAKLQAFPGRARLRQQYQNLPMLLGASRLLTVLLFVKGGDSPGGHLDEYDEHLKRKIPLNIMVVGRSGLGKSSCIRNLFEISEGIKKKDVTQTVKMSANRFVSNYGSKTELDLTVIDTVGFGSDVIQEDHQNLKDETISLLRKRTRQQIANNVAMGKEGHSQPLVHLILYFIGPHQFDAYDKDYIMLLSQWAVVRLVVTKADSMTHDERDRMKQKIKSALAPLKSENTTQVRGINFDEDPYVVLCKNRSYEQAGFHWSTENRLHSDLPKLRQWILTDFLAREQRTSRILMMQNFKLGELSNVSPGWMIGKCLVPLGLLVGFTNGVPNKKLKTMVVGGTFGAVVSAMAEVLVGSMALRMANWAGVDTFDPVLAGLYTFQDRVDILL